MGYLKLVYLNVRSLCSAFSNVVDFIITGNYDIVGLAETWLSNQIVNTQIHINGYKLVRIDRGKRGGGLAFYLRENIRYEILLSNIEENIEHLWLKIKYRKSEYSVGLLYRPPQKKCCRFFKYFRRDNFYLHFSQLQTYFWRGC